MSKCPCCGSDVSDRTRPLLSLNTNRLMAGAEIIQLGPTEAELMFVLIEAMPRPADKEFIYARLWGANPIDNPHNAVNAHVCKLRKKIAVAGLKIKTHWGRGYGLEYRVAA